ncbi:hypothetical protein [Peribacillus frigoritolerans]|uniref:hypothetical protein n=1 Tax=Peribacillus frigoritolerans TaxID=450367 RepID=UPI00315C5FF3
MNSCHLNLKKQRKWVKKSSLKILVIIVVGTEIQAGNYVLSRTSDNIRVFVDIKDESETENLQTIQWEIDENGKKQSR